MSHPWYPQPYYATRQARLTAPVPEPMGFGNYTAGIFDEDVNMPTYMHEPTGVHGCGPVGCGPGMGFGSDAGCMQPGEAAQHLVSAIRSIAGTIKIGSIMGLGDTFDDVVGAGKKFIGDRTLADVLPGDDVLVPFFAQRLQGAAREWAQGKDAIIHWVALQLAGNILRTSSPPASAVKLIEAGLRAASKATIDKLASINICHGQSAEISTVLLAQPSTAYQTIQTILNPAFRSALAEKQAQDEERKRQIFSLLQSPAMSQTILNYDPYAQADAQVTPTAAAGKKTAMLVGAAAIAALLLLR